MGIKINFRLLILYGFFTFLSYLAAAYFGNFLSVIFYLFLFYPLISFVLLLYSYVHIQVHQRWSFQKAIRKNRIRYWFGVWNEGSLPVPRVVVHLGAEPSIEGLKKDRYIFGISRHDKMEKEIIVQFPYRGIYSAGVKRIEIQDIFQFFSLYRKVTMSSILIYPRIYRLIYLFPGMDDFKSRLEGLSKGDITDPSAFSSLRDYRSGESIRHLYWKKFAAMKKPVIKEYDRSESGGIHVYFDLRQSERETDIPVHFARERTEVSVEILVAVVKYFLEQDIEISVKAPGKEIYEFKGNEGIHFSGFYETTLNFNFRETVSPSSVYRADPIRSSFVPHSILFISHVPDPEITDVLREVIAKRNRVTYILNLTGSSDDTHRNAIALTQGLSEIGVKIIIVRELESIGRDTS